MKLELKRWNFGVTYRAGLKIKDRHFISLDDAQVFFLQQRKLLNEPILFRFRPENFLLTLSRADIYWLGYRIRLWLFAIILLSIILGVYLYD